MATSRDDDMIESPVKGIPAERGKSARAVLDRALLLLGRLCLKRSYKYYPYQVAYLEQELVYCLEALNDMQTELPPRSENGTP